MWRDYSLLAGVAKPSHTSASTEFRHDLEAPMRRSSPEKRGGCLIVDRIVAHQGGNMKTLLWMLVALAFLTACTTATPDAGQEAVVIEKPWFFGHGGVLATPVTPGRSYFAPSSHVVYVNMLPQVFLIHFEDFMSKDGVPLDFDAGLRLQVIDSVRLVRDFGIEPAAVQVGKAMVNAPK
jgi:hypothetical protein